MTTTERLANEFAAVFPHAPSDSLHGQVVAALRKLATWEAEKASEQPPTNIIKTAPERIWLNLFTTDEDTDGELLFPADHEGITWADSEVGDHDVPYIRADLAKAGEQQAERLTLPNGPTKIPRGTLIFHDHWIYRWPNSANGDSEQNVDIEFNAVSKGDMIELTAPGFGGTPYRNGSILVKAKHWFEGVNLSSQEGTQP